MFPSPQTGFYIYLWEIPCVLFVLMIKWWPNPLLLVIHGVQTIQVILCMYRYKSHKWANQWQFFVGADIFLLVEILCLVFLIHEPMDRYVALASVVWIYEVLQSVTMYNRFEPLPYIPIGGDSTSNEELFHYYSFFHVFYVLDFIGLLLLFGFTSPFLPFWFSLGWILLLFLCTCIAVWLPNTLDYQTLMHHSCLGFALVYAGVEGQGKDSKVALAVLAVACSQILWNIIFSLHSLAHDRRNVV